MFHRIPAEKADGEALSKSFRKKLLKQAEKQSKAYAAAKEKVA